MKLLLINPSYVSSFSLGLSYGEPLGLVYLASSILKDGRHEVEILDGVGLMKDYVPEVGECRVGLSHDQMLDLLSQREFDAMGITVSKRYTEESEQNKFILMLKEKFPEIPLIAGGPEITVEWETYCRNKDIDYFVLGEGEKTIIDLLEALSGRMDVRDVPGIVFRDRDGTVVKNEPQKPVDVDEIPWPARDLLPMATYFRLRPAKYYRRKPAATILTSRACPYDCSFCNLKAIWGTKWRGRNPYDVVDEIEHLVNAYGVREILIQDSNFLANPKRAEAICDEIIRRKLNITMQVQPGLSVWLLTKPLLRKLKDSGLYALCAQIESGNEKTLKYMNKRIDLEHAKEIIAYANRIGLWTQTNIILGFPFETKEDIKQSIRMAESLHIDNIDYVTLDVIKHTKVYDDYVAQGLLQPDVPFRNPLDTPHLTGTETLRLRDWANRNHYLRRFMQIVNPMTFYTEMRCKLNSPEKMTFFLRRIL